MGRSACTVLLIVALSALAQEETTSTDSLAGERSTEVVTIAVMELSCNGVSGSECAGLSNRLRSELVATRTFDVVERSRMEEVLREQGFQQTGCTDEACAVEIGQLLNTNQIVVGSVDRVGNTLSVGARIVDVATAKILRSVVKDCGRCEVDHVLTSVMGRIAQELAGKGGPPQQERGIVDEQRQSPKSSLKAKPPKAACTLVLSADKSMPVYVNNRRVGPTPVPAVPIPYGRHRVSAYNIKELSKYNGDLKRLEKSRNRRDKALAKAIRKRLKIGTIEVIASPGTCPIRVHFTVRAGAKATRPVYVARELPSK